VQGPSCEGVSLNLFSPRNAFRQWLFRLIRHSWFETVVLMGIVINCVLLAVDNPGIDKDSTLRAVLDGADIFFAIFFLLELMIKVRSVRMVVRVFSRLLLASSRRARARAPSPSPPDA
jgi:hypothetical protein